MTVPSNDWSASSSISLLGMSRWLVGSSRRRTLAGVTMNLASASLAFSPPDRNLTGFLWKLVLNFIWPRSALRSLRPSSGAASTSVCSTPISVSRPSAWFW